MNCQEFRDAAMDLVDGTLAPAAEAAARAHERDCAACAAIIETVRRQSALLSRIRRPEPPQDLGGRIERALGSRGKVVHLSTWRAWTVAAAAAIAVTVGLIAAPRPASPERAVQIVDVELPNRGAFLGRITPTQENPEASLLDPLEAPDSP